MTTWETYKLGDIAQRITSGGTPSTRKEEYYKNGTIPWLKTQEINFNRIYDTETKITNEGLKNSSAKWIDKDAIVVAMYGATAGRIAINKIPLTTNQACCNITVNKEKADYNFVYYNLKNRFTELVNMSTGAAQQNLNSGMLRDLDIKLPKLTEQHSIASILSSLDDKIELNQQMNQTLENMAQAIFKEWFVNFNFPGFDGKLVDGLPKGWKRGKLDDIVDVKGGTTPSTAKSEYWDGEFHWATPKDLSNKRMPVLFCTERKITKEGVKQIGSGILPKGTLLLSSRAPIGYLAISQTPVSINQGFIAIIGKEVSNLFMLFWLKYNMEAVRGRANGSTFQEISKSSFKEIGINIPSDKVLEMFDSIISSLFDRIISNELESDVLTQLRDSLLPKLMSGKVKVPA